MLASFAMICSWQKQDSAAQQQLARRKANLDEREKGLESAKGQENTKVRVGGEVLIADRAWVKAETTKETAEYEGDSHKGSVGWKNYKQQRVSLKMTPPAADVTSPTPISCRGGHFAKPVAYPRVTTDALITCFSSAGAFPVCPARSRAY